MQKIFHSHSNKKTGAILIIFALITPGILAIIGLLIDIGYQLTTKSQIYSLATAGAHAGATVLYKGDKAVKAQVINIIEQNNNSFVKSNKDNIDILIGHYDSKYSRFIKRQNNINAVQVSITKDNLLPFSSLVLGKLSVNVIAYQLNNQIALTHLN